MSIHYITLYCRRVWILVVYFRRRKPVLIRERMRWPDARDRCNILGGNLLEPKTQDEYEEARQLRAEARTWIWLGGSDHVTEGTWKWSSDGSPVDLTRFWGPGQPSASIQQEDYMCMNNYGTFFDCWNSDRRPFACGFPWTFDVTRKHSKLSK